MKKVVMTVLVGLGFAGVEAYHTAKTIPNVLSPEQQADYKKAVKMNYDKLKTTAYFKNLVSQGTQKCKSSCESKFPTSRPSVNGNVQNNNIGSDSSIYYIQNDFCACNIRYWISQNVYTAYGKGIRTVGHDHNWKPWPFFLGFSIGDKNAQEGSNEKMAYYYRLLYICDFECRESGDPGHNIYNLNSNTCACRVK